jgi:RimJ/RimL family protein N-acetyltransferase
VLGFGYWAVREKTTGRFVGEAGVGELRRDVEPSIEGTPEAGWAFAPSAHGKGYATEAVRAVLEWTDANLGPRSVCMIDPGNTASLRVAAKCGFRERLHTTYLGDPTILLDRG